MCMFKIERVLFLCLTLKRIDDEYVVREIQIGLF